MFDHYSKHAKQLLFVARWKAGQRGAEAIEVGDLLVAFVIEDQGRISELMGGNAFGWDPHPAFLSSETASNLLSNVESTLTRSTPVPGSTDLPVTTEVQAVFALAEKIRTDYGHPQTEPLHLLAAVFANEAVDTIILHLRNAGVTQEDIEVALRAKGSTT